MIFQYKDKIMNQYRYVILILNNVKQYILEVLKIQMVKMKLIYR